MSATPAAFDTTPLPTLHYAPATSAPTLDDDPWQPLQRKPVRGSVALPLLDLGDPSEPAGVDGARGQNAIIYIHIFICSKISKIPTKSKGTELDKKVV